MDSTYEADPKLTQAVLAAIAMPMPFFVGKLYWAVPFKERLMSSFLSLAMPMALRAIASTQPAGERIALTKHGELTEEVKRGLITRIAAWFIPSEVKEVSAMLQSEVVRMAKGGFAEEAWRLEIVGDEIMIHVINTSFLKVTADTAVDMFFNSSDALKALKDRLPFIGGKKSLDSAAALPQPEK